MATRKKERTNVLIDQIFVEITVLVAVVYFHKYNK